MTKIVDLRPNKELKNSNFEKYQFSSETFTRKIEKKLETEILRIEPKSNQDSFLEARLFAYHNHLFKNPYDSSCWFIDKNGGIWKFNITGSLNLIYTSKAINQRDSRVYNPSIQFASRHVIIINDGNGTLEILMEEQNLVKNYYCDFIEPSVTFDARFVEKDSKIIVALYYINEIEKDEKIKKISSLFFLHYSLEENANNKSILSLKQKQKLKVKGVIENVFIEKNGNYCYLIGQDHVEFDLDSNNLTENEIKEKNSSQIKIPKYCWSQDEESITIYVKIPEKYSTELKSLKVETSFKTLLVSIGEDILLQGETSNRLDSDLTTWNKKSDTLEIELSKSENGLMWNELILGDTGGEYLPNQTLAADIHSRLSHLCSDEKTNFLGQPTIGFNSEQLEECDVSGNENILQRIDLINHRVTHMVMLGSSNRVLFSEKESSGEIVCLRHDHDGCIWKISETNDNDWDCQHIHTFPGFGYVEASKTNKKFCMASPDGSFISIIEHTRHALLYEKPQCNATVSKQRILDFGTEVSFILGAATTNKYLIILTENNLFQLQVL